MKVLSLIVHRIAVNMVDDLSPRGARNLAVFPLAPVALAAITKPKVALLLIGSMPMALLNGRVRRDGGGRFRDRADHSVTAAVMLPVGQATNLPLVGMKGVAVAVPHLVMPPAHLARDRRPFAVRAGATDHLPAPSVFRRSVPLHSLVVHEAEAVRCVLSIAAVDCADFHAGNDNTSQPFCRGKSAGNTVMRWIGERIQQVEALPQMAVAA